jgi:hypothetical protein
MQDKNSSLVDKDKDIGVLLWFVKRLNVYSEIKSNIVEAVFWSISAFLTASVSAPLHSHTLPTITHS